MIPGGVPIVGSKRIVAVRVYYKPHSGAVQVLGGDAAADEVLVALVKAVTTCLLQAVRLVPPGPSS